jgi:NAD(P)-dependent dehydrogenase (short-subunit alcohol dehydrogenase family)
MEPYLGGARVTSRRVLVTGGGSGIGLAAVRALCESGAAVAAADVRFDPSLDELPVARFVMDVTSETDVASTFAAAASALHGLDVVINCAGITREQHRDIREITLESWQSVISVNLTGSFLVAREAVRVMTPHGGGVIILVGSGAGTTAPSGSIPYGSSKGGVNGLAMTLATHLAPQGFRVHNFMPGTVDTPLVQDSYDEALSNGADPESTARARNSLTDPASVGRVLSLLASTDADAMTGNVITR